jgi:hypothetical protein
MKSIKEKQILVKWARAMNEPVDPALVEEVERYNLLKQQVALSIKENIFSDLANASDSIKVTPSVTFPIPPSLEELETLLEETKEELVQAQPQEKAPVTESLIERAATHISKEVKLEENSYQQPDADLSSRSVLDLRKKIKFLEDWVSKISLTGPGGGSYWLYDLGDTNYNIVKTPSNQDVLTYNSANAKWEVSNVTNLLGTRYHGSYYDMTTQTANATSTPYFVRIGTVDIQDGFTTDGANIIASHSGVYNLQFSFQLEYFGGGGSGDHVEIWLNKNGVDQANTNTMVHVASNNPYTVAAWNFLIPMNSGDKVALRWGTLNTNIKLTSNGHLIGPAVPSVIATITSV